MSITHHKMRPIVCMVGFYLLKYRAPLLGVPYCLSHSYCCASSTSLERLELVLGLDGLGGIDLGALRSCGGGGLGNSLLPPIMEGWVSTILGRVGVTPDEL